MRDRHTSAKHIRTNASKKLRNNLRILSIVYLILFIITMYNLVIAQTTFWQVILAILIGLTAGIISARMYKISWSEDESKVIGRIDIYGGIVLVLFVVFELNRTRIAEIFSSGDSIGSIGLVLITSALFGRILGTSKKILHVLESEKII
ncbi:MAG: hypothetical protein ABIQ04_04060 [Candidatus Saccharimonadales bacterium]